MPEEGIERMDRTHILSIEELAEAARVGAREFGIRKVRLTGGEPLIRKGVIQLLEFLREIPEIEDLALTTNGVLLESMAGELKEAGLMRVNVSLDSLDPEKYRTLTRGGDVEQVKRGIFKALEVGLLPVKINVVRTRITEERDMKGLESFCREHGLQIRYIRQMDLNRGTFSPVEGGSGGHCASCNRLRLMANGDLKPCLFSNLGYNVRSLGISDAYRQALGNKPRSGKEGNTHQFYNIGG
jgi:cyclic pyranopterin phosphate synthase